VISVRSGCPRIGVRGRLIKSGMTKSDFLRDHQYSNSKWFDKPFDRLTVLRKVEGLTTLNQVEGQIPMTKTCSWPGLGILNLKRFEH
jgi:hypothetical protein